MTRDNRRRSSRIPVGFYVDQIIDDDAHRCFTTDLSALGIYVERMAEPLQRNQNIVQLEIPLPETSETLWAKGEVIYDRFDALFHGTAIRFASMARAHQRLLRDWLWDAQRVPMTAEPLCMMRAAPHEAAPAVRIRRPRLGPLPLLAS